MATVCDAIMPSVGWLDDCCLVSDCRLLTTSACIVDRQQRQRPRRQHRDCCCWSLLWPQHHITAEILFELMQSFLCVFFLVLFAPYALHGPDIGITMQPSNRPSDRPINQQPSMTDQPTNQPCDHASDRPCTSIKFALKGFIDDSKFLPFFHCFAAVRSPFFIWFIQYFC